MLQGRVNLSFQLPEDSPEQRHRGPSQDFGEILEAL